jgi:hypothetical protein
MHQYDPVKDTIYKLIYINAKGFTQRIATKNDSKYGLHVRYSIMFSNAINNSQYSALTGFHIRYKVSEIQILARCEFINLYCMSNTSLI